MDSERVITKVSPWSVAETVSRVSALATARGMKVFAVIDHSGEAKAVGLELPDTKLVIFGSPKAGTPVMAAARLAALDLPLKVLVWLDGQVTRLSYTAPAAIDRHVKSGRPCRAFVIPGCEPATAIRCYAVGLSGSVRALIKKPAPFQRSRLFAI